MTSQLKFEQLEVRLGAHVPLVFASTVLDFNANRPLIIIRGDNGTGKTTLLNLLCSYIKPARGFAVLDGVQISNRGTKWARRYGIIRGFQAPLLCNEIPVWENVALPTWRGWWLNPRRNRESITDRLEDVGLRKYADASPAELSFGQRRIAELLRIELQIRHCKSRLLLLDEPLAGLDTVRRGKATEIIYEILKTGIPTILVEHDTQLERLSEIATEVELIRKDSSGKLEFQSKQAVSGHAPL